jgi:hypothetical protein
MDALVRGRRGCRSWWHPTRTSCRRASEAMVNMDDDRLKQELKAVPRRKST